MGRKRLRRLERDIRECIGTRDDLNDLIAELIEERDQEALHVLKKEIPIARDKEE
jgi:hypothetical protein